MAPFVGLATLAFIGVGGVVGVRLLLLARRTRELPETCLGLALASIAGLGYPLALIGRLVGDLWWLALPGLACVSVGFASLYVFTWRLFRPNAGWAQGLAFAGIGLLVVQMAGGMHVLAYDPRGFGPDARAFALLRHAAYGLAFAWNAAESLRYAAMLRRRVPLGLADPVVANRFQLWGIASTSVCATSLVALLLVLQGVPAIDSTLGRLCIALCGLCASASMILAFMPPRGYLRWVAGRANP